MSNPSTTNSTATVVDGVIGSVGGTIVTVVEGMIIADVPALGFPVLKQIWEALFNWIASYFILAAKEGATFFVIDVQVDQEESSMTDALKALIAAEKTGDKDAIQKAIAAYAKAHSALVHDDGSVSLH